MTLTTNEIAYLRSRLLGRLATVGPDGRPHVAAVGVFYDPDDDCVVIGGYEGTNMAASKKFRDARKHPDVAFIVDDLASIDPWTPRGIEIRGVAETYTSDGEEVGRRIGANMPFDSAYIRLRARRIVSWGIDSEEFRARDVYQSGFIR
jgi:pyridoxamine 5'-phosphate oxidase family protein